MMIRNHSCAIRFGVERVYFAVKYFFKNVIEYLDKIRIVALKFDRL